MGGTTEGHRSRRLRGAVAAAVLLVGLAGPAAADPGSPSSPIAGLLLSARPLAGAAALPGAASLQDAERFVAAVTAGQPVPDTCGSA